MTAFTNMMRESLLDMSKTATTSLADIDKAFQDGFNNIATTVNTAMDTVVTGFTDRLNQMITNTNDAVSKINQSMSQIQRTTTTTPSGTTVTRHGSHAAYGGIAMEEGGRLSRDGTPGMPIWRAAEGAHFVESPTMMNFGGSPILYGEALSPGNREYAFPMDDGGMTFITEEPGYDANSYGLWADLGDRMGYTASNNDEALRRELVALRRDVLEVVDVIQELRKSNEQGNNELRADVQEVAPGVKDGMNHNLEHSRQTRQSVRNGQSRDLGVQQFTGGW
jgi:Mg2+ and Co2+ transporter CorA